MTALLFILGTVLFMVLALVSFCALGTVMAVRAVRRSRAFNRGRLLARAATAGSRPAREVARLRVELFDTVSATARVLSAVPAPAVLTELARDLSRAAATVDRRLSLLALEPDRWMLERMLGPLREHVGALCSASAQVRATAWRFTDDLDQSRVRALTQEVADQIAGLRAGLAAVQAMRIRSA